jgi:SAM-dependent methyltransferase
MAGLRKLDYSIVTEHGGEMVSSAQIQRFYQRYLWAGTFAKNVDVLELACGTGPGLGYLNSVCRTLVSGDISLPVLDAAKAHYGDRVDLRQLDAMDTRLEAGSFDLVILFEAVYYLPDAGAFFAEAHRLLRVGGQLLLATANKDLFDFNPSPFSTAYYNAPELAELLNNQGFTCSFFGGSPLPEAGFLARLLRFAKWFGVRYRLIPGSMSGKRWLKRVLFGALVPMPVELDPCGLEYVAPQPIPAHTQDTRHEVIYCVARKL